MSLFAKSMKWLTETFWKKKPRRKLVENVDYAFTELYIEGEWVNAVKLLDGPYKNIVYYYGRVKAVPHEDEYRLAFQYTIWDAAGQEKQKLIRTEAFHTTLGDVLVAIITDEASKGEYAEVRKHYSEESDL